MKSESQPHKTKSHMKLSRRIVIAGICLLLIGTGGYFGATAVFNRDTTIDTASINRVRRGDIYRAVIATGKIEPRTKVEIKSKASGIVRFIYVREGDLVKEGITLLELDRENLQARLKEATAALRGAEASEREANAEMEGARANLERAKYDVKSREYELMFAERDYLRKKNLLDQGLIPRSDLELSEKQVSQARSERQALSSAIDAAKALFNRTQLSIERVKTEVAQAQAVADRTEEELQNATIRSPMDGVVLSRRIEVGNGVSSIMQLGSAATLLMVLGDASQVYVKGLINESDIAQVRLNQTVLLTVESFRDQRFVGKVTRISPGGSEKDNVTNFEVEISILEEKAPAAISPGTAAPLRSSLIRPSMSVTAQIITEERKDVLIIPESAIIYDEHRATFVEVPDRQAAKGRRKVPVQIGISDGVAAELVGGLKEGIEILTH